MNYFEDYAMLLVDYPNGPKEAKLHIGLLYIYQPLSEQIIAAVTKLLAEHPTADI